MFTRCPNCKHTQELTVDQLRLTRAIVFCHQCASNFDALEQLSETCPERQSPQDGQQQTPALTPVESTSSVPTESDNPTGSDSTGFLPWETPPPASSPYWRTGALAGLLILAGQLLYFHGHALSQNPTLRRLCQSLRCPLPIYQNAAELAIVTSTLEPLPDHHQLFKALILNQANFEQAYPLIDLTLQDYLGNAVAHRRFAPQDYLLNPTAATIKPNATAELRLHIAPTAQTVSGYTFELTY
jgi:hypothetical protein